MPSGTTSPESRYTTLGFSDNANLDEGAMWSTAFALKELTPTEEAKIVALVKKAVGEDGSCHRPRPGARSSAR
jgi:hypothetical protein